MKKLLFVAMVFLFSFEVIAQSGQKWSLNGNSVSSTEFLGTINNSSLFFRTNNINRFSINAAGGYTFHSLTDTTKGIMVISNLGTASRLNFSGNPSQVLLGNGTWGNISLLNNSGWSVQNGVTTTFLPVSVGGITIPNYQMSVAGNFFASGKISATAIEVVQLVYADTVKGGKQFRLSESLRFKGIDNNDPTSRNDICGMGAPLYIQSNGASSHTIFNYGNATNVGIGTNAPQYKLHVVGNTSFDGGVRLPQLAGSGGWLGVDAQGNLVSRSLEMAGFDIYSLPCLTDNNGNFFPVWGNGSGILYASNNNCGNVIKVGINTDNPLYQLDVRGDAFVSETLRVGNNELFLGGQNQSGSRNVIYSNGNLLLQSTPGYNFNTLINANNTGNVGIGTNSPVSRFQVGDGVEAFSVGSAYFPGLGYGTSYIGFNLRRGTTNWETNAGISHNGGGIIYASVLGNFHFISIPSTGSVAQTGLTDQDVLDNTQVMVYSDGRMGIGTQCVPYDHRLAVDGKLICEEVTVKMSDAQGCWPDYVFSEEYKLMPLPEVETYIAQNGHLPNMPSAAVVEEGLELKSIVVKQQQTIEELMLYILELNRRLKELEESAANGKQ